MSSSDIISVSEYISLAVADAHKEVSRFTYPLFAADKRDRPILFASCVLVECDGSIYIVTAAHAVAEIKQYGSNVHVGTRTVAPLSWNFEMTSHDGSDPLDLAVMLAPPEIVQHELREVLPASRTTFGREFRQPHFRCIHGYPCSRNKPVKAIDAKNLIVNRYGFTYAGSADRVQDEFAKYEKDPRFHVAICYEEKSCDESGQILTPPHPKGISGGGLWLVPDSSKPTQLYLEGVAIEYHKKPRLVFATRIECVFAFIRSRFSQSNNSKQN